MEMSFQPKRELLPRNGSKFVRSQTQQESTQRVWKPEELSHRFPRPPTYYYTLPHFSDTLVVFLKQNSQKKMLNTSKSECQKVLQLYETNLDTNKNH